MDIVRSRAGAYKLEDLEIVQRVVVVNLLSHRKLSLCQDTFGPGADSGRRE